MSTKAHVEETVKTATTETVVVDRFTLPKSVKNEDAHFIADNGTLSHSKKGTSITLSAKSFDEFLERKGVSKEEHAKVFKAQEDFVSAAYIVGGHCVADVAKKAKAEGLEGENETVLVKAQSKFLRPSVAVHASSQSNNPRTNEKTTNYGQGTVRFQYKGKIAPELVDEMAALARKALGVK